jgi:Ca2+/Na+ antiporter
MSHKILVNIALALVLVTYITFIGMFIHSVFDTSGTVLMAACFLVFIYKFVKKDEQ